ncbi:MAG TPA: chloride channel protein [Candidatus Acidoferrum sp.]|nr:chloride channel protein [Candidatus Acidoferrum sp.]
MLRKFSLQRVRKLVASRRAWSRRLVFWGAALSVGLIAVVFAELSDRAQAGFRHVVTAAPLLPLALTPAGFALSAWITRRYFPGSQGSGIPQTMAARATSDEQTRRALLSLRVAGGKIVLTLLGLLVGASVGREGPTVQVGAAIMLAAGTLVGMRRGDGMILAGGAAGVAAAFNTPLAGIVFAIEELARGFEHRTSGVVLTAVILAGLASLAILGNYSYFGNTEASLVAWESWLAAPISGVAGGLLGAAFTVIVVTTVRRLPAAAGGLFKRHPYVFAAACGLAMAGIGVVSGGLVYGTGYGEARAALEGSAALPWWYGLAKLAATTLAAVSGIPGGIFSPSLSVGAGLGAALAWLTPAAPQGAVVLLGMVGYFAGVVQAPITAFVIVMEMTNNQTMILPLMTASLIGYGVSRLLCREPIYYALSRQFLPTGTREPGSA